jgi:hypothetical protein
MIHGLEIAGLIYLAATLICWLWGLIIRFRYDGISLHVLGYQIFASLLGLDIYGNTLTAGNFDETISSRMGIAYKKNLWWGIIGRNFLEELQEGHCSQAIIHDARRARDEHEFLKARKPNEN